MTASESTPTDQENVTESIDYEQLGRETAAAELERHAMRIRSQFGDVARKIEQDELTQEDIDGMVKELANARIWAARVAEGRYVRAWEVLDGEE